jgi:hypothetical protein
MVAGELGGNIAAQPGRQAMADTFMQECRRRRGDNSHADDGEFVMPIHGSQSIAKRKFGSDLSLGRQFAGKVCA